MRETYLMYTKIVVTLNFFNDSFQGALKSKRTNWVQLPCDANDIFIAVYSPN